MKTPKFSIIVPAHNSAAFIRKCLESVTMQHFKDYELIVVCDNCEDDTWKIAAEYADIVTSKNYGNDGLARQAGINQAHGEWVLFLDDDDWWLHEHVLDLINESLADNIDILCFGFIFKDKGYARPIRFQSGARVFWPSVWNKCYRRSFIEDVPFHRVDPTPDGQAADIEWTTRLIEKDFRFGELDQALYYYDFMRKGSQTDTKVFRNGEKNDR